MFSKEHTPLPNGKHFSRTMMKRKTRKTPQTKRKGQAGIFGSKRSWLAMGTLAAYAAIGANRPAVAAVWKTGTTADGAAATLPPPGSSGSPTQPAGPKAGGRPLSTRRNTHASRHLAAHELKHINDADRLLRGAGCQPRRYTSAGG